MSLPDRFAEPPVELTIRELLQLFGERTRDTDIVERITRELEEHGLCSDPPLTDPTLSGTARIVVRPDEGAAEPGSAEPVDEEPMPPDALRIEDMPTARLDGRLVSVRPDDDLGKVLDIMIRGNLSQLPVMSGPYLLNGVVSWKSITLGYARGAAPTLKEMMQIGEPPTVRIDADLLATIPDIYEHDYVFVRDLDMTLTGIVTAADLSDQFRQLSGPYLRLGEIERRLRRCVNRMCPTVEILREAATNPESKRKCSAKTAAELTLFQIEQIFTKPDRWAVLGWQVQQNTFIAEMKTIRQIRNKVAHFKPDPLKQNEAESVYAFAGLVKDLVP
jgi:CBS domain-containing protein